LFDTIRRDLYRAVLVNQHETGAGPLLRELFNPGTQAILVHRFGRWADGLPAVLRLPLRCLHFLLQYYFSWRVGIYIPIGAKIGPGLVIHNWSGGIVLPCAPIGRDLTIIGGGILMDYATRGIGVEVQLGGGTKVVGKVQLGDRVRTGPNSVIQTDVPDDMIAYGNPARIIRPIILAKPALGIPERPVEPAAKPD